MNILREKISEAIQHLSQAGALVDAGGNIKEISQTLRQAERNSYDAYRRATEIEFEKIGQ